MRCDYRSFFIVGYSGLVGMLWLNGVCFYLLVKFIFLDWIDEKVKEVLSLKELLYNLVFLKSLDFYRFVEKVEDVISKILVLNGIEDLIIEIEWGVCFFDFYYVVLLGVLYCYIF